MVLFEDTIEIALKKKKNACAVGTLLSHEWQLDKTVTNITHSHTHPYGGYL
jgi:hypothetical protein